MLRIICFLFCSLSIFSAHAQEFLWTTDIQVASTQSGANSQDRQVYANMKESITRYMNFNKWTQDQFQAQERIKVFMQLTIQSRQDDNFQAIANIRLIRPTYNSTYETIVINLLDDQFNFTYIPFQDMPFSDNSYTDELTSLLNFYGYVILGMDYDSFSPNGGQPYFQKAFDVCNLAQSAPTVAESWTSRSNQSGKSRYWLAENMQNGNYKGFHTALYKYHREGLDKMESNPSQGRKAINEALKEMKKVYQANITSRALRIFFDSKSDELIAVYKKALMQEKVEFLQSVTEIDAVNAGAYNQVMQN